MIGGNLNWDHGYIGGPIKGPFVIDTISEEYTDRQMQSKRARLNFNLRHRSKRFKGLQYGVNGNFMMQSTNMVFAWLDDTSGITEHILVLYYCRIKPFSILIHSLNFLQRLV